MLIKSMLVESFFFKYIFVSKPSKKNQTNKKQKKKKKKKKKQHQSANFTDTFCEKKKKLNC